MAEVMERLHQPAVVGEIIAGILLGPSLLHQVQVTEFTKGLAEIGAIFLLFTVGLEAEPRDLLEVGWVAGLVGTLGVIVPFVLGFGYIMVQSHHNSIEAIFVGAAMVATSVGITARVLADLGVLSTRAARVILAAAVLDDILGMIILAVVSSLSTASGINYVQLVVVTVEAVAFTAIVVAFGSRVVRRLERFVGALRTRNAAFVLSVIICLGFSLASVYIGMAAIIGAFLAGLAFASYSRTWALDAHAGPVSEFLTPFFFVLLGVMVDVTTLARRETLVMVAVVTVLAIAGKIIGCGLGSISLGTKDALRIGMGMVPRGEVGLIIASVGLTLHTISDTVYTVVLFMSLLTTLFAPPFLRIMLRPEPDLPAPPGGGAAASLR
ncbi:MAG TPA: cation:proton antiporter [Terriglobia bacterium]|nr:cation:proton antiporter [Terriglobia bacterium]